MLNCLVSSMFLGVPLSWGTLGGVLLVVGSTFLFNWRAIGGKGGGGEELSSVDETAPLNEASSSASEASDAQNGAALAEVGMADRCLRVADSLFTPDPKAKQTPKPKARSGEGSGRGRRGGSGSPRRGDAQQNQTLQRNRRNSEDA